MTTKDSQGTVLALEALLGEANAWEREISHAVAELGAVKGRILKEVIKEFGPDQYLLQVNMGNLRKIIRNMHK